MQENPTPRTPAEPDRAERFVLETLLVEPYRGPWAAHEIALEAGKDHTLIEIEDALAALQRKGLVHRCQQFAWPTRAASAADALQL